MQCLKHTYTKKLFIVYIKFKFNWIFFIYLATLFMCLHIHKT